MSTDFKIMTHVELLKCGRVEWKIFEKNEVDLSDNVEIDFSGVAFLVQWAKITTINLLSTMPLTTLSH